MKPNNIYDIAIIGGGINGMAIARDAAGRGLKTYLCEKDDFGSATSAWSSKMLHGGLRYLEFFEFGLVRKALKERDVMLRLAPHMVKEQRFIVPHLPHLRPSWMIRLGLFLYDHLYQSAFLRRSHSANMEGLSIRPQYNTGFEYSDTVVDDHRLVIELAMEAQNLGATLQSHTICTHVDTEGGLWKITTESNDKSQSHFAKQLVNATGPWAESFLSQKTETPPSKHLRLVKGSHIVVPQLYREPYAYTFQDNQGRVVFTFPYLNKYTLIGTTEEPHDDDPNSAKISDAETQYLASVVEQYFGKKISIGDIIWHFSGVRPLIEEAHKDDRQTSRDYNIEKISHQGCEMVNIWGGKLTTHRALAEDVLKTLNHTQHWTSTLPFTSAVNPGVFPSKLQKKFPFLTDDMAKRLTQAYGNRCLTLLKNCQTKADLGQHFGNDLYEKEVRYLIQHEWAQSAESVLFFRTKCGVGMSDNQIKTFKQVFAKLKENS